MKIGFYCESPADEAALRIFTKCLLGAPPEPINMDLEAHSMPAFFSAMDGVFRGVHYNSDAEGLVIVGDCDDTEMHDLAHDIPGARDDRCRHCQARRIVERAQGQVRPRQGRLALKVAIGFTVPSIEAWYLVGENHEVGEAASRVALNDGHPRFTRSRLKEMVYGNTRPSLEEETQYATRAAGRICQAIGAIESAFPAGFGQMANEIRSWRA